SSLGVRVPKVASAPGTEPALIVVAVLTRLSASPVIATGPTAAVPEPDLETPPRRMTLPATLMPSPPCEVSRPAVAPPPPASPSTVTSTSRLRTICTGPERGYVTKPAAYLWPVTDTFQSRLSLITVVPVALDAT